MQANKLDKTAPSFVTWIAKYVHSGIKNIYGRYSKVILIYSSVQIILRTAKESHIRQYNKLNVLLVKQMFLVDYQLYNVIFATNILH